MNTKKYEKLRKERFKERGERFKQGRERIKTQRKALGQRNRTKAKDNKEKLEHEKKTKEAVSNAKATVEESKKKTKAPLYPPEKAEKLKKMVTDTGKSFDSADREKTIQLSPYTKDLLRKEGPEATKKSKEDQQRRKREAKYFYGIVPSNRRKSFGSIGIKDGEVYTIPYGDISAVVSDSPMKDYELMEDNLTRHGQVLTRIMEEHTVVPVEFGTTIRNERILKSLMAKVYNPARECLRLVDNKVELGVKAVLNEDTTFTEGEKRKGCISDILTSLNPMAKQAVTGDLFSNRLILNASFLVDKEDIGFFSEKMTELQDRYPTLKILYSGPWAPYNFVYIKVGAKGLEVTRKR